MVSEIIWSSLAIRTYGDNIDYLEKEWSSKEVNNFIKATERKLAILKEFPETGFSAKQDHYLRRTLIGKRIILIYRYKPRKGNIELLRFFNSWRNPEKLKRNPKAT